MNLEEASHLFDEFFDTGDTAAQRRQMKVEMNSTIIYRDNSYTGFHSMYAGYFHELVPFDKDLLAWRYAEEDSENEHRDVYVLTLGEIAEQLKKMQYKGSVTVFCDEPTGGEIYTIGNHGDYEWDKVGTLTGFA